MNPDQPSREQIEARITALLLGELPAAEAELLRWTISKDPELLKLHDQLKVTIGFVSEAMKNPADAPLERETPLKMQQERQQTLMAHFKTARPQPPEKLSWLRRIEISSRESLVVAAVIVLFICGLAAISIPNFVKARATSESNAIINNLRQIDAAKQEWAFEQKKSPDDVPTPNDLSPYLEGQLKHPVAGENYVLGKVSEPTIAEIKGKQLVASRGTYGSEAGTTSGQETTTLADNRSAASQQNGVINNMRQLSSAVNEWKLETGQPHLSPNSPGVSPRPYVQLNANSSIPPVPAGGTYNVANVSPQVQIALPNTESARTESTQSYGQVYSQNVVGYVNINVPTNSTTSAANQMTSAQQTDSDFSSELGGPHNREEKLRELSGNAAPPLPAVATATPPPTPPVPEVQPQTGSIFVTPSDSGRTYETNFAELSEGNPSVPVVEAQPGASSARVQPESPAPTARTPAPQPATPPHVVGEMTMFGPPVYLYATNGSWSGVTSFGGGTTSFGGGGGAGKVPLQAQNNSYNWSANEKDLNGLQDALAYVTNGMPTAVPNFNFPSDDERNSIAMNQDRNVFSRSFDGSTNSPMVNALPPPDLNTLSATATLSERPRVEPAAPIYLPPRLRQQYAQNGQKLSDSIEKTQITEMPALTTASTESLPASAAAPALAGSEAPVILMPPPPVNAATAPVELSSRMGLENQNANTPVQSGGGLLYVDNGAMNPATSLHHVRNREINPATGLPEAPGSVPAVKGVPVTGELFPSSVLRSPLPAADLKDQRRVGLSPQSQQQYGQNGPINRFQSRYQLMASQPDDKEADKPLPRPQTNPAIPQPEILTSDNAFSTFSMNVSDVSFKLAMASLDKGQMPDPASIRSEEFINAFDYHDPEPLQGEPLGFISERAIDPFAHERDLLRFSIKAAAAGRQQGRALNLVLLLDTSGSMERADRVAIIRKALRVLSGQLQSQDIVSVVTFSRTARLWADGIPGNAAGATLDKVGSITPEGGTNLEEAMRLAYETALRHFIAGGMNRVVLLTDGAANLGNVDPQALTQKVEAERRQGIALDCFGIGWDDYNDDLLAQLSSNGDGRYAFINSPDEAATEFAAKLAGALEVAAEDVKVQVEFNPNRVTAWRQIGYAKHQLTKQQFRDNTVAAGAIASREAGNALYVIETKPDGEGPIAMVRVRYRVPGTQDNYERSWSVDYDGVAPDLAQSSAAMRLAVSAAEISEWMADSPFAQEVTPDELLNYLSGVPQIYGTDERPKQLEWMIREAGTLNVEMLKR